MKNFRVLISVEREKLYRVKGSSYPLPCLIFLELLRPLRGLGSTLER